MTVVRIAGLMRSGTNLLTWMLRHNFEFVATVTMLLGWKHGPIIRDRLVLSIDDFVDPRYRSELHRFAGDHPDEWQRVTASSLFRQAAEEQRAQNFGVALAVRDPGLWYASCLRVHQQRPDFLVHGITPGEAAAFWNSRHRDWLGTLGERSVIVDSDALGRDPEPVLARIATSLQIRRTLPTMAPQSYLHPKGMEEIYELLGAAVPQEMQREFTTREHVDPRLGAEFNALLDRGVLDRLGLARYA